MDKLKKYLQEHQPEMDIDIPSGKVWQRIQATAAPVKKTPVLKLMVRYAAAACLLAATGIGIKYFFLNNEDMPQQGLVKKGTPVKNIPGSFDKPGMPADTNTAVAAIQPADKKITANKKQPDRANKIDPYQLMRSFENNYTQLVNLQLNSIRSTPVYAETQGFFSDFKASLKQMDADEILTRTAIRTSGLNEQLLQQLINIYQEKLNVLKSLQAEINKINNRVKQNQLPTDTLSTHFINI